MAVERLRQQRTPTEFGPEATALSSPDLSAASFSTQGVRDSASAVMGHAIGQAAQQASQGVGFGMQFASDFHTGMAMADLEKEHEQNIQNFLDSQPENQGKLAVDAGALNEASNSLWSKLGEGASIDQIDAVQSQYNDRIARLQRAQKQGVMSSDEFAMNTLAITRQAINKNPYLFDELTNHAKKVLGMSGTEDFIKAQKDSAEAQQKMYQARVSQNMQILKENNIPARYDSQGNYDLVYGEQQAQSIQMEKFAADSILRTGQIRTEQQKSQAADFINKFGVQGVNGLINQINGQVNEIIKQPGNKSEQMFQIRNLYQGALQTLQEKAGPVAHLDGVKDTLTYAQNTINAFQKTFESFNNREDQQKFLNNSRQIFADSDYIRNAQIASPAAIENLTKILTAAGPSILSNDSPLWGKTQTTLVNMLSGVQGIGTDYTIKGADGKSIVANGLNYLAGQEDAISNEGLSNMFKSLWQDTKTGALTDPAIKFKTYDDVFSSMANTKTPKGFSNLDSESLTKVTDNFADYMQMTLGDFSKDLSKVQGLKTSTLPDGRIQMTGTNSADTSMLTLKYGIRLNNAIKAYSNLLGIPTKQAAENLFQQYPELSRFSTQSEEGTKPAKGNKPTETNPLNLTVPGKVGQFQQFNSVDEGLQAASAQLDRYFTGKTTGKPLTTVSDIVGLWNNENEKGSMSKKDYVSTVVKYSGLDPNAQLDLKDPNVKADLMYGMAKAEGRNLRPSQILMALNK